MLSGLIPDTFSFQGNPVDLPPIEDITDILLNALWDAYVDLHFPLWLIDILSDKSCARVSRLM